MFVGGNGAHERLLCLLARHATLLDKGPKRGVVQIVDVTVDLAPAEVVSHHGRGWIEHGARIEGREPARVNGFLRELEVPLHHIVHGHEQGKSQDQLHFAAFEQHTAAAQEKQILVRVAVRHCDVGELLHHRHRCLVHHLECAHVIGLVKVIIGTELVEALPVDPNDNVGVRKEEILPLKRLDVLEPGISHVLVLGAG